MRSIAITVGPAGEVTVTSGGGFLGFGGEHNAAALGAQIDESSNSVFFGVTYYRVVFDEYISDALYSERGIIDFRVPMEALNPPKVGCQIVAFRVVDGEAQMISKSDVFYLDVKYSKKGTTSLSGEPDVFERTLVKCEGAKDTAVAASAEAEVILREAMTCAERCEAADESVRNGEISAEAHKNGAEQSASEAAVSAITAASAAERAESVLSDAENEFCNVLYGNGQGQLVVADHISPVEDEMSVSVSPPIIAESVTEATFDACDYIHILPTSPVSSLAVHLKDFWGNETVLDIIAQGAYSEAMLLDVEIYLYILSDGLGEVRAMGTAKSANGGAEENIDLTLPVSLFNSFASVFVGEGETVTVAGRASSAAVQVMGKNFWIPFSDQKVNGVRLTKVDDYYVLNGTASSSALITSSKISLDEGTYTLSANNPTHNAIGPNIALIQVYSASTGLGIAVADYSSFGTKTGLLENASDYELRIRLQKGVTYDNFIIKPQLELGEVATEYQPYCEPVTHLPYDNGVVDGIEPFKPTTVLKVTSSASDYSPKLTVKYRKDINGVINSICKAITALGGKLA